MSDLAAPRRSTATRLLIAGTALVTAAPVLSATLSVLRTTGLVEVQVPEDTAMVAGFGSVQDEQSVRVLEGYALIVTLPVALTCLLLLVGLLRWRQGAREAVLGLFGLVGGVVLVFGVAAVLQGRVLEPLPALLGALLALWVARLSVHRDVVADFGRAEHRRRLRPRVPG